MFNRALTLVAEEERSEGEKLKDSPIRNGKGDKRCHGRPAIDRLAQNVTIHQSLRENLESNTSLRGRLLGRKRILKW